MFCASLGDVRSEKGSSSSTSSMSSSVPGGEHEESGSGEENVSEATQARCRKCALDLSAESLLSGTGESEMESERDESTEEMERRAREGLSGAVICRFLSVSRSTCSVS